MKDILPDLRSHQHLEPEREAGVGVGADGETHQGGSHLVLSVLSLRQDEVT